MCLQKKKKIEKPKPKPCRDILPPLVAQRDVGWAAQERALFTYDELDELPNSGTRHEQAAKDKHGEKEERARLAQQVLLNRGL